jgi:hypothetical protein
MDMPIIKQKLKEKLSRVNVRMGEAAKDDAKKLGLDYMSFGRWGKDGKVTTVDKTWKYVKDDAGKLRIVLHHSSLPYSM